MKPTAFLTRFALILFIKNINGQNNALVYNKNCQCNGPETMQQPISTYAIYKTIQDFINQNENTAAIADTQKIGLPPDLQQQPIQVQQYLQLGKPLVPQQAAPLQQPLQVQPSTQVQPFTQPQLPFDTIQPVTPLQTQDAVQLQPPQKQPQLQLDKPWQSYQPVQPLQSLEAQQLQQSKQVRTSQPLQQTLQLLDSSQPINAMQQPFGFPQFYPEIPLSSLDRKNSAFITDTPFNQNINNIEHNSKLNIKLQSSNPLGAINIENPYNTQTLNIQPRQTFINSPIEVMAMAQKFKDKPQDTPSLSHYIITQPPASSSVPSAAPIVSNFLSAAIKPSVKPIESPLTASYTNMIPSPRNQIMNTQLPYYNPATDLQNNKHNNQISIFRYEQSTLPVDLQRQSRPFVSSQSAMLPFQVSQAPIIPSQYAVSPGYPIGTVIAPSNTRNKSVSSSLKSILPIIFQLLKEKISTCSNDCPCECKNDKTDNKLDVACGYSNQREYGHFAKDALPVLDTVSEEEQGPVCLREPKNCEEIKNATLETINNLETSGEISEEEGSDEEEIDEDEET